MDMVIEKARELGKLIQQDQRYIRMIAAEKANDADTELQDLVGKFNDKRAEINEAMAKTEKDEPLLQRLNVELRELYDGIMSRETMKEFGVAKQEMNRMTSFIDQIIAGSINGEDVDSIEEETGCGGNCSGCSGCH